MEHDVSEEVRPSTLDFKVDRAIQNKTYDQALNNKEGTQNSKSDDIKMLNIIEQAKFAIKNDQDSKQISPLVHSILKCPDKVTNFLVLYNKEEKLKKLDHFRVKF